MRSPFAHARIGAIDASAALALPGVIGVVTGADVAAHSRPFGSALGPGIVHHAAAVDVARYVGEPVCVVVARDRYLAEDAAERVLVDYEPLPVAASVEAALAEGAPLLHPALGSQRRQRPLVHATATPTRPSRSAAHVVRERFRHPRSSATPVECYGVIAHWQAGGVTAWANFQGPFTLHGVAAAALGIPGAKLRLLTPSESGGSFGTKAAVLHAVVLMAIASRCLGVPVRWTEDRNEHLLAGLDGDRAHERGRGRVRRRRPPARAAARPDRRGRRLRPRARAGHALPHARLPDRAPTTCRISRCAAAWSSAIARPSGPQPRLRRPAALQRARAHDVHRRAAARDRPGRARAAQPRARRADALPRRRRRRLRLGRLPGLPRARARAGRLRRSCAPSRPRRAPRARLLGIGLACVVEPSVSNMGYITLVQSAEERAAGLPKSGNAEGVTIAMGAQGGVTLRITTTPQGQGHRTVAAQVAADVLGLDPEQIDVRTDADTAANPWTVSSGNYSSRFAAMGASAVHLAATRLADRLRALAAPLLGCAPEDVELAGGRARVRGDEERSVSIRRLAGARALAPERPHGRGRRGARADRHLHAAHLAAGRGRPRQLVGLLRLRGRRLRRRDRSGDGRDRRARLRHGARRRPAAQPAAGRRPGARRPRARPGRRAARGAPLRRGRQPHDRRRSSTTCRPRRRSCRASSRRTWSRPRRSRRWARRASARARR